MNKEQEVTYLHLDDIIPNRFQPREVFEERALKELAVSIKEHGVIQPIIVREIGNNKYEIIAGERRYKASALAGLTKIPAIIRNLDDKEAAKVALLENLQRKNLNPIEEARTYQKIIELDQMTQEELAKTMGKSQSAVANKLRLLSLPEEIQKALLKEQISERHARSLLNIPDPNDRIEMLKRVMKERMSVRKLEQEIKNLQTPPTEENEEETKETEDLTSLINPTPVSVNDEEEKLNEERENTSFFNNMNNEKEEASEEGETGGAAPDAGTSFLMTPPPTANEDIVNYGEIEDEEEPEEETNDDNDGLLLTGDLDINKLKSQSSDIGNILQNSFQNTKDSAEENTNNETNTSDLDSILNLKNQTAPLDKSITPAEAALRESDEKQENKEDYFSVPDLMNVNLPDSSGASDEVRDFYGSPNNKPIKNFDSLIEFNNKEKQEKGRENDTNSASLNDLKETLFNTNNQSTENSKSLGEALMGESFKRKELANEEFKIREAINKIRETLKEIETSGMKVDTDEMNFEQEYQILIKINKSNN